MDRNGFRRISGRQKARGPPAAKKTGLAAIPAPDGAGTGGRLKAGIRIGGTSAPG